MKTRSILTGFGMFTILVYGAHNLSSQETPPQKKPLEMPETEEDVLKEKVEAFESLYKKLKAAIDAGGGPYIQINDLYQAENEWKLAQAELALIRKDPQKQIRHLVEAVNAAEKEVKAVVSRREILPVDMISRAIVRRADTKLALIRARKGRPKAPSVPNRKVDE